MTSNVTNLPAVQQQPGPAAIMERVLLLGDLSKLTADERTAFYMQTCASLGLNPLTRPFDYIRLSGREVLYAKRDCADQLRKINRISLEIIDRKISGDLLVVAVRATTPDGRSDEDMGVVSVKGLGGEALGNAMLKCVPLDTEILTRDGWKTFEQLTEGELVLGYDMENDRTEWTRLEAVNVFDAMEMGTLQTEKGRFSVRCTTGHRWVIEKKSYKPDRRADGSRGPRGAYKNRRADRFFVEVQSISAVGKNNRLVLAAPEADQTDSILTPAEAAVLGWAVTDGTIQHRGSFTRLGICQSKTENFAEIEAAVGGVSDRWTKCVTPAGERTFPSSGQTYKTLEQHWWYLPAEISRAILKRAGFQSRIDLPRIATRLNSAARRAMLQALMLAEGSNRPNVDRFINTDPSLMDTFQILCALEGISTGGLDTRVNYDGYKPVMCQSLKKRRHLNAVNLRWKPETTEPAWCPTTGLGTWVMRQAGTVTITGNCVTKAKRRVTLSICGLGMLDETEVRSALDAEALAGPVSPDPKPRELAGPLLPPKPEKPPLLVELGEGWEPAKFPRGKRGLREALEFMTGAVVDGKPQIVGLNVQLLDQIAQHLPELAEEVANLRAAAAEAMAPAGDDADGEDDDFPGDVPPPPDTDTDD